MMVKRRYVPYREAAKVAGFDEWWEVPIENMGWCKDDCTKWYHFFSEDGELCYTLKRINPPKYN